MTGPGLTTDLTEGHIIMALLQLLGTQTWINVGEDEITWSSGIHNAGGIRRCYHEKPMQGYENRGRGQESPGKVRLPRQGGGNGKKKKMIWEEMINR